MEIEYFLGNYFFSKLRKSLPYTNPVFTTSFINPPYLGDLVKKRENRLGIYAIKLSNIFGKKQR